jgi:predicted transcriptional regulator
MLTTLDRLFLELIQDGHNTLEKLKTTQIFNEQTLTQLINKHVIKSHIKFIKGNIYLNDAISSNQEQIDMEVQHLHSMAFQAREKNAHMYHLKKCKLTNEEFKQLHAMMVSADIFVSECGRRNKNKEMDCYYHLNAYGNYYKLFNFN